MDSQKKILVVDDVAMFREIESVFLARSGRVFTAASGPEAIATAQRIQPDLMVVDLAMPGMDGEAVCRAVRADPALGDVPLVVLSSSDLPEDRARALRAGADDVLSKPISRVALIDCVRRFLRFGAVRGLPRVAFQEAVRILDGSADWPGRARNLSRGGIFVEADKEVAPRHELEIEFALPETDLTIRPSAEVVWQERRGDGVSGMGLRFLGLDGHSARYLEEYVHDRIALPWVEARR